MGCCMSNRTNNDYSVEFKKKAVQLYLKGGRGYRKLAKELGLKDKKTLRGWVAKVQRGESLEDGRGKATNVYKGKPRTKFSSLEEKLAYLEAERDYLKKLYRSRFGHEWGAHKKVTSSR